MWPNYSPPNNTTNPNLSRGTKNSTWSDSQIPRNYKDDTRVPSEILLSRVGQTYQKIGNNLPRMHQIQTNQNTTNTPKNDQPHRFLNGIRIHTGDRRTAQLTEISRISTHHHDDRCILTLSLCIPNAKYDGTNRGQMHHRRHDETRLPSHHNNFRKRITVHSRGGPGDNQDTRHRNQTCNHKTCANNRHSRNGPMPQSKLH